MFFVLFIYEETDKFPFALHMDLLIGFILTEIRTKGELALAAANEMKCKSVHSIFCLLLVAAVVCLGDDANGLLDE